MNKDLLNAIAMALQAAIGVVPGGGLAATILALVETAVKEEPAVETALRAVFTKADPTPEDWAAARQAALDIPEPIVEGPPPAEPPAP